MRHADPDFAGEKIRKKIAAAVPGCKHAFLPREEAKKDGDIGIENASPKSILAALEKVRTESTEKREEFKQVDLIRNGLIGNEDASHRRDELGKILGIGYGNAKQFLSRLNNYGVSREEFNKADGEDNAKAIEALKNRLEELSKEITANSHYTDFANAQNALNTLMDSVNAEIKFCITGERPVSCTHDCSTCGGCGAH